MNSPFGVYVHVPFCHRICTYCDFAVTTARKYFRSFVEAVDKELTLDTSFTSRPLSTLYVGGGTPSFLPFEEWNILIRCLERRFSIHEAAEWTLEVNPSDVSPESAAFWKKLGFNRLSLGVQSFRNDELKFLTRNHTAREAEDAFIIARDAGFHNINLDLIFGLPDQTLDDWTHSLETALSLQPEHVSVYNLTIEEGTHLHKLVTQHRVALPEDEHQLELFISARTTLENGGYEHYEISNYAKPGCRSRHNSAYWRGLPYLGLGPSAHSYDGSARWWNVRGVVDYIRSLQANRLPVENREELTREQRMMEKILLGLRQKEGLDIGDFESHFGCRFTSVFAVGLDASRPWYDMDNGHLRLTPDGMFVYNAVCRSLIDCISA